MSKLSIFICLFLSTIFISCKKKEEPLPIKIETTNYIPLSVGKQYIYKRNFISRQDSTFYNSDTLKIVIEKDTFFMQKSYFKVHLYDKFENVISLIRKEGNNYYEIPELNGFNDSTEYLVMKDNVNVGDTWSNKSQKINLLDTFKVMEIKKNIILNGTNYTQVAIVSRNSYIDNQIYSKSIRYYVSGIGEIYSYLPYPESRFFVDVDYCLIGSK